MRIEEHQPASRREAHLVAWVQRLLRLYPRAWRDRYEVEVSAVLAAHPVTYWTALDILLGTLDAHLHRDLLPGRLTSMAHRIRTSEIAIFCAFALFCIAWLPLDNVGGPAVWQPARAAHPELLIALTLLGLAVFVAGVAILVGGVPLLVSALAQSIAARRWRLLVLFLVPLFAVAMLVVVKLADIPWASASSSAPNVVVFRQPIVMQVVLILLPLVAIGGSAAAVAAAIARSELRLDLFRFALLPARVVTAALVLGLLGAVAVTALTFAEGPQPSIGAWPSLQVGGLLLMLAAVVLAGAALRHGLQASRNAR